MCRGLKYRHFYVLLALWLLLEHTVGAPASDRTTSPGELPRPRLQGDMRSSTAKKVLTCKGDEAERQAKHFGYRPLSETACPAHMWLARYQGMSPSGHKLVLDIGCNRGFESAGFFDVFAPELGVNKLALLQAHSPPGAPANMSKCGVCGWADCTELHQTPELTHGHRLVEVHCVEPSDVHYAELNAARQRLFGVAPKARAAMRTVGRASGLWHLYNMAVSNETGTAIFTSQCDHERCQLGGGQDGVQDSTSTYKVQVTTVDSLLASLGSPSHVTFMKVDTEGFDASVLQGAQKALKEKVIHMFLFEYHRVNRWQTTQLQDVSAWLESLGYACYFEGLHHIYKITGNCWDSAYEFHEWSNVVCGLAGGQIELMLDAHSYLRRMRVEDALPAVPKE